MRRTVLLAFCALFLGAFLSDTYAISAPAVRTPQAPKPSDEDRKRIAEYLAQCLKDWDTGTHMTKKEWARVCERVVDSRAKFRLEEGLGIPDLRQRR
jgi:hypothetical protein